ncbi:MAG: DUF2752 domain-containing protein [Ilumatobacteraceae bacterium]|nr:DUF2752 domain-containing protein [Ilumatobacteraceae bacterium]
MQATVHQPATLAQPSGWRRAAPIVCGCVALGAAAVVARFDPAASGSRFPACQFKAMTGLWCPGCGLTRGFHQLFTGHPISALQYNVFVPLVLCALVIGWWSWMRSGWGRQRVQLPAWAMRPLAVYLPIAVVFYGVLRNIPAAPFSSLAP